VSVGGDRELTYNVSLLMNSQAGKVGKCGFYVSYNERIPPCVYKKIVPNHLERKTEITYVAEETHCDLAFPSVSSFPWQSTF
jgi:hypothetical protein